MVTKITRVVYDDLDGSATDVGTYRFAFNGVDYEIDLSRNSFDRMGAAFQPFVAAARRLPTSKAKKTAERTTNAQRAAANAAVRQWWATHWQEQNLPQPNTRGVIPAAVRAAYDAAQ